MQSVDLSGLDREASKSNPLMEIDTVMLTGGATAEDWRKAINKVVPAVLVMRTTGTRAFDTETAASSYATGFIVDKRRGIILTNRHVVRPGPVVAEATFLNREEVPIYPLYRDPVHDFGFFHFDPEAVQFMECEEIPLAPEVAAVGLEIRVVGNDSGEKISILAGTIARLDRDAPHYRRDSYNDFNTFYMQAASGTKGGSSGSPVIDCHGRAVALNAGSKTTSASAFFLPLERVVRALRYLQEGKDELSKEWRAIQIPRGTLQMTLMHKGFDETRRLGLKHETEQIVRQASSVGETGMLVVDSVVPGGPAYRHLEPGDILVRANGEVVTQFLRLETVLDDNVGKSINLEVERGGQTVYTTLLVQDLHTITPDYFVEVSGGVIHPLSYQQARNFRFTCGLVYVAEPGYMLSRAGVPRHAIITKLAGEETSHLDDFLTVFSKLCRGARVPLEFITHSDRHRKKSVLVTLDRHEWYAPPQLYRRDDTTGIWQTKYAICNPKLSTVGTIHLAANKPTDDPVNLVVVKDETMDGEHPAGSIDGEGNPRITPVHFSAGGSTISKPECDQGTIESILRGESKKRRVEGQLSDDCTSTSDYNMEEREADGAEDLAMDHRAGVNDVATVTRANASMAEKVIEPTLVMFEVHIPPSSLLDGVCGHHFFGTGVIVYHSQNLGLVAVDKNTVAIPVSDVMLSFSAYPVEIPAEVVFLHPVHNFALVAYDPAGLGPAGAAAVQAAVLLAEPPLQRGDAVNLVGLSRSLQATSRKSIVTNLAALNVGLADCPRYRAMNMEVIELDTDFGRAFSGVLADELGRIQALWASFSTQVNYGHSPAEDHQFVRGIPIYAICEVLNGIINGKAGPSLLINGVKRTIPVVRILEAELYPTLLSKARSFGLSDNWVLALAKKDPVRRQVLRVKGCLAGSRAESALEQGDMILAIDGEPITCFRDVENACNLINDSVNTEGTLKMTVFRQGTEMEVLVGTDVRDGFGTIRTVNWSGSVIQEPHPAVRALGYLPKEGHGVYIVRWCHGSPVNRYSLYALQWIIELNGKPTPDLDAFLEVAKELEHGAFVRVKVVHLNGKPRVLTLKQDLKYWPTLELRFDPETATWHRKVIKSYDQ